MGKKCCKKPVYDPTPEEIAAVCEDIQRTWSRAIECRRRGVYADAQVETPRVSQYPKGRRVMKENRSE